jgi:cobalt-zinc-cadmium efflux system membrane fusion protein
MDDITAIKDRSSPVGSQEKRSPVRRAGILLSGVIVVAAGAVFALREHILLPLNAAAEQSSSTSFDRPGVHHEGDAIVVPEGSHFRERIGVAPVQQSTLRETRSLPAVVEADPARTFNILPPLGGGVTQLFVRLGDQVSAGQALATIESGDLAQAYSDDEKAAATVAMTDLALKRARDLSKTGGIAVKDLESAQNDSAQALSEASRAQARLKSIAGSAEISGSRALIVKTPASGTVTALSTAPGAYINDPTVALMTIANLDEVYVTANVAEKDLRFISKGQDVDIVFPAYPGETFRGNVLFISDVLEPDTRRTKVRISFRNPGGRFKPNMFATVNVLLPAQDVVTVPNGALLMNNDSTTVFVETAPWRFVRRPIKPGYEINGTTTINSGLAAGDRVVARGGVLFND